MSLESNLPDIPADLEQALWMLKRAFDLSPRDLLFLQESTEVAFVSSSHFSLGAWMRNNWLQLHPNGSPLCKAFFDLGVTDADKMSTILLRCLWRDSHGERRDLSKLVL